MDVDILVLISSVLLLGLLFIEHVHLLEARRMDRRSLTWILLLKLLATLPPSDLILCYLRNNGTDQFHQESDKCVFCHGCH